MKKLLLQLFSVVICAFAQATMAQEQLTYEPQHSDILSGLTGNPDRSNGAPEFIQLSPNPMPVSLSRELSWADRVAYQRAIERVYWRHRIWPKERPDPKPSLDEVMPPAQIEEKVLNYLRNSQRLADYWQQPVRAEQLQAEMERMAQHTGQPEVLRELFAALGNDPFVIAECLARPALSERLLTNLPSRESRRKESFESGRARVENQLPKEIGTPTVGYRLPAISDNGLTKDIPTAISSPNAPTPTPGCVDAWTATSTSNAPSGRELHTAVWTGNEMIVWGGSDGGLYLNTGGRYNPGTDSWIGTSTTNAPEGRYLATAVWTGGEMIVWGGSDGFFVFFNTGARYNPGTNSWTGMSTVNAPAPRTRHTAVWTGSEMIVWGGSDMQGYLNTGGRYNPSIDSWTATSTNNAPAAREIPTAIWTGSEMIVWGGFDGALSLNTGGRYNPSVDSWTTTSTTSAPSGRRSHVAVWTGSEMIVWGGYDGSNRLNTGGRYNPGTNSWISTSTTNAPSARTSHVAVWTGSEMIVWGGGDVFPVNTGGRYNPGADSWTATSTTNAPSARTVHSAVWTDSEMIVWSGFDFFQLVTSGGKYCSQPPTTPTPSAPPSTPTPTPTAAPTPTPSVTPPTLANISTRLRVETGDNVLIGGFIITGTQAKRVIVRAIGPSLSSFFPGVLADPILELRNSAGGLIMSNDNWRSDQEAEIIATGIPPSGNLESAIVATLQANSSAYSAIIRGVNNGTGIGVVEAYDMDRTVDSKLANISTRGFVQTGDNVLIGGLIVLGPSPLLVIVRAIGPSLPVPGALVDPILELHNGFGGLIGSNDNWRSDQEAQIIATGIPPPSDLESAIVTYLTPGNYTAIVRGVNNATGVALVEVYSLN